MTNMIVVRRSIADHAVQVMLAAAVDTANEIGKTFSVAVTDTGGLLAGFRRMDGASQISVQTAQDKAYSAVLANRPTHAWQSVFDAEPALRIGIPPGIPRIVVIGGGYPIVIEGATVGGIGVSGAHYEDDMKVARAGLAAIGAEAHDD